MEGKRYFCDWMDKINGSKILHMLIHLLLICSYFAICMVFYMFVFNQSYSNIIYKYDEETYEFYKKLANETAEVAQKGKEINLSDIPDGITYTITKDDEMITTFNFQYVKEEILPETIINGEIKLSSDYKVIEKEVKILKPNEYIYKLKEDSIGLSIICSLVTVVCICFISKKILKKLYDKSFKKEKTWERSHPK